MSKRWQDLFATILENNYSSVWKVDSIEFAKIEFKVFQGLKEGAKTLKEIHQQIDIGELQDIMIETEEGIQKQRVDFNYSPLMLTISLTNKRK